MTESGDAHGSHSTELHTQSGSDAGHGQAGHLDQHGHQGGHDVHGSHSGHEGGAGDYNSLPPGPSTLPPVPAWGLAVMGFVLALLIGTIVYTSLALAGAQHDESNAESPHEKGVHADKKAEN